MLVKIRYDPGIKKQCTDAAAKAENYSGRTGSCCGGYTTNNNSNREGKLYTVGSISIKVGEIF